MNNGKFMHLKKTNVKIKTSDKNLRCFSLAEIIFKCKKIMSKTLHVRSKITRENMKSNKICTECLQKVSSKN